MSPSSAKQGHAQRRIQGPQRLVQHQEPRGRSEAPGQGNALLLAAGECEHVAAGKALQPHQTQHLVHALPPARGAHALHPQAELDVLVHPQMREQAVVLEHEPEPAPVHGRLCKVPAIEQDLPGIRSLQAGDEPKERALAAAARPEDGEDFPVLHRQAEPVQRARAAIDPAHVLHDQ